MNAPTKFDIDAVRDRNDLIGVVQETVTMKQRGRRWWGCCPFHSEKTPSFIVKGEGATARYKCYGCGARGDVIGFLMAVDGLPFVEAVRQLIERGGLDDPVVSEAARLRATAMREQAEREEAARRLRERATAAGIWSQTEEIRLQLIPRAYFEGRGIRIAALPDGRLPDQLRFHPGLEYWISDPDDRPRVLAQLPAVVARISGPDGKGLALEITWLDWGGRKADLVHPDTGEILPAKKMRGNPWGGAVRLAPAGARMGFCEGKESGLSVMLAEPGLPVWACLSIGNLAGGGEGRGRRVLTPGGMGSSSPKGDSPTQQRAFKFLPSPIPDMERPAFVPPVQCRDAVLLEDADNADPAAADCLYACAAARWTRLGFAVTRARPPAGYDFNDILKERVA